MKLSETKSPVIFLVHDESEIIAIIEKPNGETNAWFLEKLSMSCTSLSTIGDFYQLYEFQDESDYNPSESEDWKESERQIATSLDEIKFIEMLLLYLE